MSISRLKQEDLGLVMQQRESRGSVLDWLITGLAPICETCEQGLYEHAQGYQDLMLRLLLETIVDLGPAAAQLNELQLPDWCAELGFKGCANELISRRAEGFQGHVKLFRRKAELASLLNERLDSLTDQRAKDYMTCRAVLAAKIDFDLTDDASNSDRGESKRKMEQFFRVEASVGMQ